MNVLYTWSAIILVVVTSVAGDVLIARAMKRIGDLGELRRRSGLGIVITRVASSGNFLAGLLFMTLGFFTLLFALSWGDLSLVVPASTALTYVGNAFAGRIFLHEAVDKRRWVSALLVAGGVVLLAG